MRPGDSYDEIVAEAVRDLIDDGDVVVVSDKAVAAASGRIVDERRVKPSSLAKFLALFWNRVIWGRFLSIFMGFQSDTIHNLRNYPPQAAAHKEVALRYAGLLHALRHTSEGGIDLCNLPGVCAAIPLKNPEKAAKRIWEKIYAKTGKRVIVMISDSDRTYSLGPLRVTPLPRAIPGIVAGLGFFAYVFGRKLGEKMRSTPVAMYGGWLGVEKALDIAELADDVRGFGAGETVYEAAARFGVRFGEVTVEMLESIDHYPVVVVKRR